MTRAMPLLSILCASGWFLKHADRFGGLQKHSTAPRRLAGNFHQTLVHADEGSAIRVFHVHFKDRAAHRNDSRRAANIVGVRNAGEVLDVDFHAADHDVQQVFPRRRIGAEYDCELGKTSNVLPSETWNLA